MRISREVLIDKVLRMMLITLILATLIFIFAQSLVPPEKSQESSDKVGDVLEEIIPPDTKPGEFVQNNVRKLAHFFEFALLGAFVSLYVIIYLPSVKHALMSLPFGLVAAFLDESIQTVSERGPLISDVWIDLGGFASAAVLFYTGYGIYALIKYISKQKLSKDEVT